MKVDELIGSLLIFDMPIDEKSGKKKNKHVAFKADIVDYEDQTNPDMMRI